jgi:hypothetical protein
MSRGEELVAQILAEMDAEECDPTAAEEELLRLAVELSDRLDRLEAVLAENGGEILTSRTGTVRIHPAAVEHRQLALALARVLGGIVIGDAGAVPKNPVKQRAANARWHSTRRGPQLKGVN